MSRGCRLFAILHHNYQVSLTGYFVCKRDWLWMISFICLYSVIGRSFAIYTPQEKSLNHTIPIKQHAPSALRYPHLEHCMSAYRTLLLGHSLSQQLKTRGINGQKQLVLDTRRIMNICGGVGLIKHQWKLKLFWSCFPSLMFSYSPGHCKIYCVAKNSSKSFHSKVWGIKGAMGVIREKRLRR